MYEDSSVKVFGVSGNFGNDAAQAAAACDAKETGSKLMPNYKNNACQSYIQDMGSWPVIIFDFFVSWCTHFENFIFHSDSKDYNF